MCIINTVKWCITFYHCFFVHTYNVHKSVMYVITTDRSISCLTDRDRPRPYWSSEILVDWRAGGWTWQSWWSDQWWTGCHVWSWSCTLKERTQNVYTETQCIVKITYPGTLKESKNKVCTLKLVLYCLTLKARTQNVYTVTQGI